MAAELCIETTDKDIYDSIYDFSAFGIDEYIGTQYLLWFFAFLPMLLISICISCILGKLSDKFICVPFIDPENVKFREEDLVDAKGFKGVGSKLKAFIKAITLSGVYVISVFWIGLRYSKIFILYIYTGIVITIVNGFGIMNKYEHCLGYEDTEPTILISWISSIFAYFFIWKIDFSFGVVKIGILKKLLWFVSSKIILLIIGASFVRVVYLQNYNDTYCYCNNDQLYLANLFTAIYIAIFPVAWIVNKLGLKKFLVVALTYICKQYCLCQSDNCCCEIVVKVPTGPVGKPFIPVISCCKTVFAKLLMIFPGAIIVIMFIVAPFIVLYMRFKIISDKWEYHLETISQTTEFDITDVVFIWILIVTFTFFMIEFVLRCKRKYCREQDEAGKERKTSVSRKRTDTKESVKSAVSRKRTDTTESLKSARVVYADDAGESYL